MQVILGAVSLGLLWAIMTIGVYISYRVLDIADLTVEGSLPLGAAAELEPEPPSGDFEADPEDAVLQPARTATMSSAARMRDSVFLIFISYSL